uniref:Metalloendopeptidase n=1 Tax=Callorhinchus milii TaxID=7868 RepID=A0A4W3H082_CALMI
YAINQVFNQEKIILLVNQTIRKEKGVSSMAWLTNPQPPMNRTVDKQLILFGDIAVDASKNLRICDQCLWPKSNDGKIYVPYIFDGVFSKLLSKISTALLELSMFTCLKFVYRTNQVAHMKFISASGCWSVVGRTGSKQQVSLERPSCVHHAVIQHEVMHVLGFEHEHSRSDRDNYIRIMKENIKDGRLENFVKMRTNNMKTPYDYLSVMHYGKTYFSKNDQPTMVAISDPSLKLGQTIGITEIDVLKLNRFYNCSKCNVQIYLCELQ